VKTKLLPLALLCVRRDTRPQRAAPRPRRPSSAPPAKIDQARKKEIHDLCGRAHGQEMKHCIKSGLDMNKFCASCKSEIAAQKSKS
jgi:hypothetical protein